MVTILKTPNGKEGVNHAGEREFRQREGNMQSVRKAEVSIVKLLKRSDKEIITRDEVRQILRDSALLIVSPSHSFLFVFCL
jgi:hypothetical protein